MLIRLILDTDIHSILRTHQQQEVQASSQAVLERVGGERSLRRCSSVTSTLDWSLFSNRFRAYSGR